MRLKQMARWFAVAAITGFLVAAASAQPGPTMMPGPGAGGGGSMMGPGMGGGMGGQQSSLTEPEDANNEIQCLKFALDCVKTAITTYNENVNAQQGAQGTSASAPAAKTGYETDTQDRDHAFKKELYTTLWDIYDQIGQTFRNRDQIQESVNVYEEAIGYLPKDPDFPTYGGGGGGGAGGLGGPGGGGPMMGGGGGKSGPGAGPTMMGGGGGGPMMMGGPGGGGPGMGGMGGGGAQGGQADTWDDLTGDMKTFLREGILPKAYTRLGEVYFEGSRLSEAREVLDWVVARPEKRIASNPTAWPETWGLLTQLELLLGMDHLAPSHTTVLRTIAPNSASAWANNGISWSRVGQPLDALEAFRRAVSIPIEQDPRNVEAHIVAYNYMSVQELERGDLESADAHLRKVVEQLLPLWDQQVGKETRYSTYRQGQRKLLSATVTAYSNLGIIAAKRGMKDDSVAFQDAAVKAAEMLVRLEQADTGATVGDMDRALAVAGAAYSNAALARINRGAANQHVQAKGAQFGGAEGDYTTALEYLQRAVAAAPNDAASWNALGVCYYRVRRFYDAQTCFEQASTLNPASDEYKVNLQAVRERLGGAPHNPIQGSSRRAAR